MKRAIWLMAALAMLLGGVGQLQAEPITYTDSAIATGTLGSNSFTNALVTITFTGNTANVTGGGGFFTNTVGTVTVTVAGIGTATFTDSMDAFVNQTYSPPAAGISDLTQAGSVLDTLNAIFASYNLSTSIGPITGDSFIRPDLTFGTTSGGLNLRSAGNSTFTASIAAVPEPTSVVVFGMATFAGAVYCGWRRRKQPAQA